MEINFHEMDYKLRYTGHVYYRRKKAFKLLEWQVPAMNLCGKGRKERMAETTRKGKKVGVQYFWLCSGRNLMPFSLEPDPFPPLGATLRRSGLFISTPLGPRGWAGRKRPVQFWRETALAAGQPPTGICFASMGSTGGNRISRPRSWNQSPDPPWMELRLCRLIWGPEGGTEVSSEALAETDRGPPENRAHGAALGRESTGDVS